MEDMIHWINQLYPNPATASATHGTTPRRDTQSSPKIDQNTIGQCFPGVQKWLHRTSTMLIETLSLSPLSHLDFLSLYASHARSSRQSAPQNTASTSSSISL